MDYMRVEIFAEDYKLEDMAAILSDGLILGAEIKDPSSYEDLAKKKNEYDWDYLDPSLESIKNISPSIEFYLEDNLEGLELLDEALEAVRGFNPEKVEISSVREEDWQDQWKEYFKPVKITEKLVVKPSWEDYEAKEGELVIDLDPGMAFGTGDHPTSRLCMLLMEKHLKTGMEVLDIGCGSGILSIGAALLGAGKVLGVEIDPVALKVAKENVNKNRQEEKIDLQVGDLNENIDFKGDIVLANLMADLVIRLAPNVRKNMKEKAVFISSGILLEKKDLVAKAIEDAGLTVEEIIAEGEWCAISAR